MQIKTGDTVVVIAGKDKYTKDKKGALKSPWKHCCCWRILAYDKEDPMF